ncbi:D-2-hydroxyacid dehydrogenase [Alkalicoccus urumqiensis]|uniref:Hydroxyacid dehydrogenase n=1 Tax=Alkalicoccus urumqiensis TaxID=1548213 RepID=A0A2P6MI24_ALKUR|nr:D-2-hydroxyacid dehydrogenase [Alkalicoccus urumqiensis]PRO65927.1 hydroxyacid dehydrogenase [Alkalicoccus urumqiensis]
MKRKMFIGKNLSDTLKQELSRELPDWAISFKEKDSLQTEKLQEADVIAAWKPEMEEEIGKGAPLSWIQTWSAGVDQLPLERYAGRGWRVTSANGVHARPISETIFAMLLGWTRKIAAYVRLQGKKEWHHAGLKEEIHGQTVLLYGMGAIGTETARLAEAFGMRVIGVRRSGKHADYTEKTVTPEEADAYLEKADVVVNTLPLTENTKEWFTKARFEKMNERTFFINIGRGGTVEEKSLVEALQNGVIAGAGLDVFDEEPLPENHPFWEMEQVILTPHTAGSTKYYDERVVRDILIPNVKAFEKNGELPVNEVDVTNGY